MKSDKIHLMNILLKLNKKRVNKDILFWTIIIAYLNIYNPMPGPWQAKVIGGALDALNCIFAFYSLSLFVIPKFWNKRIYLLIICIILGYCIFSAVSYFNYLKVVPYFGGKVFYEKYPISSLLIDSVLFYFIFGLAGSASFFYRHSILKHKSQAEKEKSLLVKELNFLKNQFNSHITFNFLNYCFSNIEGKHPSTAESIGIFSDMLRYAMQTKPDKKVLISDEIKNIENFINLKKLLSTEIYIKFSYSGATDSFFIYPRILITFVENAFKHGLYNHPQYPIVINLEVNNNKLFFKVTNRVNSSKKMTSTYTGLENVKQIIDLYYANSYELTIDEKVDSYNVKLCVNDVRLDNEISAKTTLYGPNTDKQSVSTPKLLSGENINPLMRLNKQQIQRNIITWTLLFAYLCTIEHYATWSAKIISPALFNFNFMFVFYSLSLFVFPKFWDGKWFFLFLGILICLLLYWANYRFICFKIDPALGNPTYYQKATLFYFLKTTFYYFVITSSAGIATFFYRYGQIGRAHV